MNKELDEPVRGAGGKLITWQMEEVEAKYILMNRKNAKFIFINIFRPKFSFVPNVGFSRISSVISHVELQSLNYLGHFSILSFLVEVYQVT